MNTVFNLKIADLVAEVTSRGEYTKRFCADFLAEDAIQADLTAFVEDSEIEAEMISSGKVIGSKPRPEYCENVCIYRAIAEQLPFFDRFVFHGASIAIDGKGFVFTAPSGTGKSTHISLWKKVYGDRVTVVNGDKPIIGLKENDFRIFSSPWAGKEGWKTNTEAPLSGICILSRGAENHIERVDAAAHFERLMTQTYLPKNGTAMLKTLELIDLLSKKVPFYLLACNISEEAARVAYDGMM